MDLCILARFPEPRQVWDSDPALQLTARKRRSHARRDACNVHRGEVAEHSLSAVSTAFQQQSVTPGGLSCSSKPTASGSIVLETFDVYSWALASLDDKGPNLRLLCSWLLPVCSPSADS